MQIAELREGPAGSNSFEFIQLGKNKVLAKLVAKSQKDVNDWVKDFKNAKAELAQQVGAKDKCTSISKFLGHVRSLIIAVGR